MGTSSLSNGLLLDAKRVPHRCAVGASSLRTGRLFAEQWTPPRCAMGASWVPPRCETVRPRGGTGGTRGGRAITQ
eukprot:5665716-Alexandrium_andersonii.AAC.1